jgi:hypothetical protein
MNLSYITRLKYDASSSTKKPHPKASNRKGKITECNSMQPLHCKSTKLQVLSIKPYLQSPKKKKQQSSLSFPYKSNCVCMFIT